MRTLFQEKLNRRELLAFAPPVAITRRIVIAVHRNHSFELTASVLNVFLGLSGIGADFWYSGYDDSLSFSNLPPQADLHLIWIDATRYRDPDFASWLSERTAALHAFGQGKILAACCGAPDMRDIHLPDAIFLNVDAMLEPLGDDALDLRLEPFTGTRLSNAASLVLARELGTRQIPALLLQPLKVIVLDLDNTLHAGVLAEDGPHGVKPHTALQEYLSTLARKGFLLALASKNEEEDVRRLFAVRKDFPLRWEDFAACQVNWQNKADSIRNIAAALNIGLDAILFVDDNPGEIFQVARTLPQVHTLLAGPAEETVRGLHYYPGLCKNSSSVEDGLRSADIHANAQRVMLKKSLTAEEYLRELGMRITFEINPPHLVIRVAELLNKTNQFILAHKRLNESAVLNFISAQNTCVITAHMEDNLSDSGVIAVILARQDGQILRVEEIAVSCRVLGRGIEDGMLKTMLALAAQELGTERQVAIAYKESSRNRPALDWLQSLTGSLPGKEGIAALPSLPVAEMEGVTTSVRKAGMHV